MSRRSALRAFGRDLTELANFRRVSYVGLVMFCPEGFKKEQPIVWPTRNGQDRGMFLRRNRRQHGGELDDYWS